jgi:type I restriction enzyme S subunit
LRPLSSFLREPLRNGHSATASSDPNGIRTLTLTAVTVGDFSERNTKITCADAYRVKDLWLEPGDILIQRSNAPELVGTSKLYRGDRNYAIFPDLMIRVRLNDEADPRFIELVLQSEPLRQYFKGRAKGMSGSMPKIDQETISEAPIPHFHIPDQRRIVAEIEKQFTRLEAGVAALRRVQANLKRYRAAVLKAAGEGRLVPTEAELALVEGRPFESGQQLLARILTGRRQNWKGRGKYKEPAAPNITELSHLPDGWTWATAEQLTDENRSITYGVIKLGAPIAEGVHVLRSSDVRHLKLDLEGVKRIDPEIANEYQRTFLKGGEVLMTVRGTLGGVVVAPPECKGFNISREVAMLAMIEPSVAKIAAIFIGSDPLQHWLLKRAKGIAYTGINIETLKELPIPLPPLAEQTRIVAEVERRLSVVEELEAVVTTNLQRATRLRQSVLQKAFTGELG